MAFGSESGGYVNRRSVHVEEELRKLEKQGTEKQLSVATTVPPLPSLAKFSEEEGDKELNLEHERERQRDRDRDRDRQTERERE